MNDKNIKYQKDKGNNDERENIFTNGLTSYSYSKYIYIGD